MPTKAYSYIRFSNIKQEKGDSIARQIESRDAWIAKQKDVVLDTDLDLTDAGVTSSSRGRGKTKEKGKNYTKGTNLDPSKGKLGQFVKKCEEGKIPSGSYLILDSMDRFSRDKVWRIGSLFETLVTEYGLKIVILNPSEKILDAHNVNNQYEVLMMAMTISMSHEYAEKLSYNVKAAWKRKRDAIRDGKEKIENTYPSWLELQKDGQFKIKQSAKTAINFIYEQIKHGVSQKEIVKQLNEKYDPITKITEKKKRNHWNVTYVCKLASDRRLLGEIQLQKLDHDNNLVNDGPPVHDYYPRMISDQLFYEVQAAKKAFLVKNNPRTKGRAVNLFQGLIHCTEDNQPMFVQEGYNLHKGKRYEYKRLISYGRKIKKDYCKITLNYNSFENLVVWMLSEIAAAVVKRKAKPKEETIQAIRNTIQGYEQKLVQIEKAITNDQNANDVEYLLAMRRKVTQSIFAAKDDLLLEQQTESASDKDFTAQLKGLRQRLLSEKNRHDTKNIIRNIVYKILVKPLRLENRKTICIGALVLRNGNYRFFMLADGFFSCNALSFDQDQKRYFAFSQWGVVKYPSASYWKSDEGRKTVRIKKLGKSSIGIEDWKDENRKWWSTVTAARDQKGNQIIKDGFGIDEIVGQEYFVEEYGKESFWDFLNSLKERN